MTRIRYKRNENSLVTNYLTLGPNQIVRGIINLDNTFSITNTEGMHLTLGRANSLREAKAQIRKLLVSSGLVLEGEIRRRSSP